MTNINLSRSGQQDLIPRQKMLDKTTWISIVILVITGLVYGGLVFGNMYLQGQIDQSKTMYTEAKKKVNDTPAGQRVTDFSRRSEEIVKHIDGVNNPADVLGRFEKSVIQPVTITSYSRKSDGTITLEGTTDSIKNVAQQAIVFKSVFSNVIIGKVSLEKDGQIKFSVTMLDKTSA